jgi:VWFA-related protein
MIGGRNTFDTTRGRTPRRAWILAVVAFAASFATFVSVRTPAHEATQGQTQSPTQGQAEARPQLPRFRGGANLVRVDVYPTLKGAPVKDLTIDDFDVLEDGVRQKVESFEFVQISSAGAQEGRREPNNARDARSMAEDSRARLFVIYLDVYYTELSGSHRIQRSLVNMLNQIVGPDDMFAVMTPDMSPRDLSFARRSTTVEGYLSKYWFWGQRGRLYPADPVEQQYLECYPDSSPQLVCPSPAGQTSEPADFYKGVAKEMIERRHEKQVLDGLTDLSEYLGGLREERKAVITISNGWLLFRPNRALQRHSPCRTPPGIGQPGTTPAGRITNDKMRSTYGYSQYDCDKDRQMLAHLDNWQTYEELMDIANRANVSFYPVDSRGLAAFDRDLSETPVLPPNVEMQLVRNRVESLRTLASNTDGLAVTDTNNLDQGFERIVADLTSYYLLGYYSTNTSLDGRVRKIKVRVKRDGVDVRARRGYKAATQEELEQGQAEMTAAAAAAPPSGLQAALNSIGSSRPGIPLRTAVSYVSTGTKGDARTAHVWALAELDPGLLRSAEWLAGGEAEVQVSAADGTRIGEQAVTLAGGQRALSVDLGEVVLPAGELVVRTRIKPSGEGLSVSDTVRLTPAPDSDAPGVPILLRRGPTTGMKYVPTADRQFRRTERLRVDLPASGEVGAPSAEILDRTGKTIVLPVTASVRQDGSLSWASADVALAPLAVGDYALKLRLERGGKVHEVITGFRVVP